MNKNVKNADTKATRINITQCLSYLFNKEKLKHIQILMANKINKMLQSFI